MLDWEDVDMDEILEIRDNAAAHLEKTNYIPISTFNKVERILTEYRSQLDESSDSEEGQQPESIPATSEQESGHTSRVM